MEKQKCPELRFSEFKNYWNEIRLGDVVDNFSYGLNAQAVKYDGKHKYIRITDIDDNSRSFLQDNLTSPDIDFEKADNYILKKKDILFARTGASVGKTYLYNETDGLVYFAGFLIRGKIKNDIDEAFIFANTQTERFHKFIRLTSQRSGQPGINAKEYTSFEFYCSDFQEQVKIGEFFKNLDESIVLHEKKLVQTQNLKKAMLEKMFPKQGSKRPEIRLKGFSGDWVVKKLGDVVDIVGGGTPDTNVPEFWNGEIDWYSPTEIGSNVYANGSVKKITKLGLKNSSAKILPAKKTVLFSSRAGIGDMAILNKDAATNQGFQSFIANNIDIYFLYSMGFKIKKFALSKASGSTFLEISRNQLAQMDLLCPAMDEQEKIGEFFKQVDETIKLQQQQLQTVKNLKQALLEKMFV